MHSPSALILGGAGFLGTHLGRQLVASGRYRRVVSLDIAVPKFPVGRVLYRKHDVREPIHRTIDTRFDVVFNFAAVHRTPGHADHEYYDTNVAGALNAVAFCERRDIPTLLFTSSISVYGPSEHALDENSSLDADSAYGRSKILAEVIHRDWFERGRGRRLRIVRPAVVFGEGEDGNYSLLAKLLHRGLFAYPGRKDTLKAGGYVKELVRSMLFALDRPESYYLYNFAEPQCASIEEICRTFHDVGGMRRPIGVFPRVLLDFLTLGCEALNAFGVKNPINRARVAKLVHSTHIVPRRLMLDGYQFAYTLRTAIADWLSSDPAIGPAKESGLTILPELAPASHLPEASRRHAQGT